MGGGGGNTVRYQDAQADVYAGRMCHKIVFNLYIYQADMLIN